MVGGITRLTWRDPGNSTLPLYRPAGITGNDRVMGSPEIKYTTGTLIPGLLARL